VLWTGSPVRYPLFSRADLLRLPFIVAWFAFGVFWLHSVDTAGGGHRYPPAFRIWGGMVMALGLGSLAAYVIATQIRLRHTTYTLTDRRVVVRWRVLGGVRERSVALHDLGAPTLTESSGGIGTIRFGSDPVFMTKKQARDAPTPVTLRQIRDPRLVRATVDQARMNPYQGL
jgi:hypothetical protein